MNGIASVVVLYNPVEKELIYNINSYIEQVHHLYVIDNSEVPFSPELLAFFEQQPKITYISNGGNQGIAKALNIGCQRAVKDGYKWLLTMDQDSDVPEGLVSKMYSFINSHTDNKIGIVAPSIKCFKSQKLTQAKKSIAYSIEKIVITSGGLLSLEAYEATGPFEEQLFIDSVDTDYCFRLAINGYVIYRLNDIILNHQLGDTHEIKLFGRHIAYITNHSYVRRYYMTRNIFYLGRQYQKQYTAMCGGIKWRMIKDIVKIILLEKEKKLKLRSILIGYRDFKTGTFGKVDINRLK